MPLFYNLFVHINKYCHFTKIILVPQICSKADCVLIHLMIINSIFRMTHHATPNIQLGIGNHGSRRSVACKIQPRIRTIFHAVSMFEEPSRISPASVMVKDFELQWFVPSYFRRADAVDMRCR